MQPQNSKPPHSAEELASEEREREEKRKVKREGENMAGQTDLQQCGKDSGDDVSTGTTTTAQPLSQEELRRRRLKHLEK